MKPNWQHVLLLAVVWVALTACKTPQGPVVDLSQHPGTVRVACVGDSITFGAGLDDRDNTSYPAVLGRLLGSQWETRNFGVSGATLLKKGDLPYWKTPQFTEATEYKPDVVVIKLGTNDTKPQNWRYRQEFEADLRAMVSHFNALPSHPKVLLCLPVPVYETRWGINDDDLIAGVIPAIRKVGQEKNVPIIDLYDALSNRPDLFPDKVHPNADGAAMMARAVASALLGR